MDLVVPGMVTDELENAWALPSDADALMRALAYRPRCSAAGRHQNRVIADLCRALGIPPPWKRHSAPPA